MTSAPNLVGGATIALVAFFTTSTALPHVPDWVQPDGVAVINVFLGFLLGWTIMGKNVTSGIANLVNVAATTAVAFVITSTFVHSLRLMLAMSGRRVYTDAMDAIANMFERFFEIMYSIMYLDVALVLFGGALIAAMFTQRAARIWR